MWKGPKRKMEYMGFEDEIWFNFGSSNDGWVRFSRASEDDLRRKL